MRCLENYKLLFNKKYTPLYLLSLKVTLALHYKIPPLERGIEEVCYIYTSNN